MSSNGPDSGSADKPAGVKPLVLAIVGAAAFIALLVVIIYLTSRLEQVEDRLRYDSSRVQPVHTLGIDLAESQTVYVPAYSHIYAQGGKAFLLEATLSIRNPDPERAIEITSVSYFDTKGALLQDYLKGKLILAALESTAFLVEGSDVRGGSGANFIVTWKSDEPVYEPVIEVVMVGLADGHSLAFKSIGRPLAERGEPVQGAD